jgi:hypothetical protein
VAFISVGRAGVFVTPSFGKYCYDKRRELHLETPGRMWSGSMAGHVAVLGIISNQKQAGNEVLELRAELLWTCDHVG